MFKAKLDVPAPSQFHPELDDTDFINENDTKLYQSYIGILRWAERIHFLHKSVGKWCINRQSGEFVIISAMRSFYSCKEQAVYC
jgi:hypothetical protein